MPTEPRTPRPLSDADAAELAERWHAVLPHQEAMGAALVERYREPWRRYHDVRHLLAVLRQVDALAGDQDLFIVRLAAWFHDAVYDIPSRELTNEEASARLALRELSRAGLEQEDLTQVARLVRMTAEHVPGQPRPRGRAAVRRRPGRARRLAGGVRRLRRRGPRGVRRRGRRRLLRGPLRGARALGRGRDLPHRQGQAAHPGRAPERRRRGPRARRAPRHRGPARGLEA